MPTETTPPHIASVGIGLFTLSVGYGHTSVADFSDRIVEQRNDRLGRVILGGRPNVLEAQDDATGAGVQARVIRLRHGFKIKTTNPIGGLETLPRYRRAMGGGFVQACGLLVSINKLR